MLSKPEQVCLRLSFFIGDSDGDRVSEWKDEVLLIWDTAELAAWRNSLSSVVPFQQFGAKEMMSALFSNRDEIEKSVRKLATSVFQEEDIGLRDVRIFTSPFFFSPGEIDRTGGIVEVILHSSRFQPSSRIESSVIRRLATEFSDRMGDPTLTVTFGKEYLDDFLDLDKVFSHFKPLLDAQKLRLKATPLPRPPRESP